MRHLATFLILASACLLPSSTEASQASAFRLAYSLEPVALEVGPDRALLVWETTQPAMAAVRYGVATGVPTVARVVQAANRRQALPITGLQPNTAYTFAVQSYTAAGELIQGPQVTVTTATASLPSPQFWQAPTLVEVGNASASLEWEATRPTQAQLRWRQVGETVWNTRSFEGHLHRRQHTIAGLQAQTAYEYQVTLTAIDFATVGTSGVFVTGLEPDATAPRIVSGPYIRQASPDSFWIEWTTSEPTTAALTLTAAEAAWSLPIDSLRRRHEALVAGLSENTVYEIALTATDAEGNATPVVARPDDGLTDFSSVLVGGVDTQAPQFAAPPVISPVSDAGWLVQVEADEPVTARIVVESPELDRGENDHMDPWPFSRFVDAYVPFDFVAATDLVIGSDFQLRVEITDKSGNTASWTSGNLTLAGSPDTAGPQTIPGSPSVVGAGMSHGAVSITLDEPSTLVAYACGPFCAEPQRVPRGKAVLGHEIAFEGLAPDASHRYWFEVTDLSGNTVTIDKGLSFDTAGGQAIALRQGWNFIGVRTMPTPGTRISDFIALAKEAQVDIWAVYQWRGGQWSAFRPGFTFGDGPIETGHGYFLYAQNPGTVELAGTEPPLNYLRAIEHGWNTLGLWGQRTHLRASDLAMDLDDSGAQTQVIAQWDNGWQLYRPGMWFNDFLLEPHHGYLLYTGAGCDWQP